MQATASPVAATDAALARDLGAVIAYLQKNCNADLIEAVGMLELTLSQLKLLHRLDGPDTELSLGEAAEAVHVSVPAASRLVDDLVRRGFISRSEDAEDRRIKRLRLTAPGRAAIARLNTARLTGLETFVRELRPHERATLAEAVGVLLERREIAACRPEGANP